MKINDIISEVEIDDTIVKQIISSDYFKVSLKSDIWLYHNTMKFKEPYHKVSISIDRDRKPVDTSEYIHNLTNKYALERFGVKVRNGLFAFNNNKKFEYYGTNQYTLLPLNNNYRIFYNPKVWDFTLAYTEEEENNTDMTLYLEQYIKDMLEVRFPTLTRRIHEFIVFGDWILVNETIFDKIIEVASTL